jgi:hypothetical protein
MQRQCVTLFALQVTAILECCELYGASLGKLLATRHALLQQLRQQLTTQLSQSDSNASQQQQQQQQAGARLDHQDVGMGRLQEHQQVQHMYADMFESDMSSRAAAAAAADTSSKLHPLQLLDQLAANMQREHVLRSMLKCFVWGRILDSIQFAKAAVYSHPLFPDVHAIVCVLHEREQQRQRQQAQVHLTGGL